MADQRPPEDAHDKTRPLPDLQEPELQRLRGGKAFPPGFDAHAIARRSRRRRRILRGGSLGLLTAVLLLVAFDPSVTADYSASVGQIERITLPNGTRVQLDSGAAISWSQTDAESRVRLHGGVALFETAGRVERAFVVEVGDLEVRPVGTVFAVAAEGFGWSALVESGQVRVSLPDSGASSLIGPGEAASVAGTGGSLSSAAIDAERTLAWRNGVLDFKNAPLTEVVRTLDRYRPGRILLLREDAARKRFDGVLSLDDIDGALQIVAESSGLDLLATWPLLVVLR
ncbi:FecR family protein [Algihabitans albus]|uniref:FecR family protein n=1 Tax=Algihabitans albus TaxID=2164067 RepID=UPI000E5D3CB7|nr:FecR domain-containing protein [Algihabitans albus]